MHQYRLELEPDGDFIVFTSFDWKLMDWVEHTRWLIPGTELED